MAVADEAPIDSDFGSENGWEYEYDDHETEEFYITLDLTTHVKPDERRDFPGRQKPEQLSSQSRNARKPRSARGGAYGQSKRPSKRSLARAKKLGEGEDESARQNGADGPTTPPQQTPVDVQGTPSVIDTPTNNNAVDATETSQSAAQSLPESIQILDLHTPEPLVAFQNRVFSCSWASSVGTDMLFTAPERRFPTSTSTDDQTQPSSAPDDPVTDAELLATTRHRLIAHPVKLVPHGAPTKRSNKRGARLATTSEQDPNTIQKDEVLPPPKQSKSMKQQDFLQQLSDLRKEKGEDPWVPMRKEELMVPKEIREARAAAKAIDEADAAERAAARGELGGVAHASGFRGGSRPRRGPGSRGGLGRTPQSARTLREAQSAWSGGGTGADGNHQGAEQVSVMGSPGSNLPVPTAPSIGATDEGTSAQGSGTDERRQPEAAVEESVTEVRDLAGLQESLGQANIRDASQDMGVDPSNDKSVASEGIEEPS
ncbi:MAG: hypothetical protein Q9159_005516 [Coniocarpon cinnabarinum]